MLRIVALVLLLANALLLSATLFGGFDMLSDGALGAQAQREPQRLQRQVDPGAVQILSPQAASAALAAAAASAAETAAQAAAAACLEAGPFNDADADAAERTLRDAGVAAGSWQTRKTEVSGVFMVYMGRYTDPEILQRKREELRRRKVEAETISDAADLQPGLNLGRFDDKRSADAAMALLTQRGVTSAKVITLRPAHTMIRFGAPDAATRARLAGLPMPVGPGFVNCPLPATAANAATASNAVKPAASAENTSVSNASPQAKPATPSSAAKR